MDELRPTHTVYRPTQGSANRRNARPEEKLSRLGQTLREAREEKGLELRDLAVLTNVRVMHLEALEKGDFRNLPEDPYSKNFVRLYAQAVGLEPSRILLMYGQERRAAASTPSGSSAERSLELPAPSSRSPLDDPRIGRIVRLLTSLLLIVLLVLLALWGFNRLMSGDATATTGLPPQSPTTESPVSESAPPVATPQPETTAAPDMVLLTLRTTPPGAEVSIDGYPFGQSPIIDAPIRAGQRTIEISRAGYQPYRGTLELSSNRRLNFELNPTNGAAATPAATPNQITLTVTETAWLEVYEGAARGEGERLVYQTANPGDTFVFSAPIYVFSGNAGGVSVGRGGQTTPLGDGVTGQAYSER